MTELIHQALSDVGLLAEIIPNSYRIQDVFGNSRSYCSTCKRVWSSHLTWIKFDLRAMRVLKNWRQRCLSCKAEVNPYITPEELKRMAGIAAQRVHSLMTGTFRPTTHSRKSKPHDTSTCEKCKYGKRPCWVAKQKPGFVNMPFGLVPLNHPSFPGVPPPYSPFSSPPATPPLSPNVAPSYSYDDFISSFQGLSVHGDGYLNTGYVAGPPVLLTPPFTPTPYALQTVA